MERLIKIVNIYSDNMGSEFVINKSILSQEKFLNTNRIELTDTKIIRTKDHYFCDPINIPKHN